MATTKFDELRTALTSMLIERDQEVELVLTALVAGEHVLLVGAPGTAKSMLCDAVADWLHGHPFKILLTKFTTPEEVFGPLSLAGLEHDRFERLVAGYLPTAEVAFVDEVWKASSAILNCLLKILNERTFKNGRQELRCPLQICLAASNEWPTEQQELGALFDRFLFRTTVKPIATRMGREELWWRDDMTVRLSSTATAAELNAARAEAARLPWTDEAKAAFADVVRELAADGIFSGDRRQRKAVLACRAAAYLAGAAAVEPQHLDVLSSVLWSDPQHEQKCREIVGRIANPVGMRLNELLIEVEQVIGGCDAKNLGAAAAATAKLQEVAKELKKIEGQNGRAAKAVKYVSDEIIRIKRMAVESL